MDSPTILVVEDEALIAMALEDALSEGGFNVVACSTGGAALAYIQEQPLPAAIVTDIRLGGTSGWEIARTARKLVATMPIVFVSGDCAQDWSSEGVPGSIMIQKPFASAQVLTAISTLLNAAPTTD